MTNIHARRPLSVASVAPDLKGHAPAPLFRPPETRFPSTQLGQNEPSPELPAELRTSLSIQMTALILVGLVAFACGERWLSTASAIGLLALLAIRRMLSTGRFGIWLGALIGTVVAIIAFAALTLLSPLEQTGVIVAGFGLLLLQLHYMIALLAPATRRFFLQQRTTFFG